MQKIIIDKKDSNQTVIKFLIRFLPGAPKGLIYKQIRNKNITLNDKKITGSEILKSGDLLSIYMSDETIKKFKECVSATVDISEYNRAFERFGNPNIIYEDEHIIILNKPVGVLSQKSESKDLSANEWLIGYLLSKKTISPSDLSSFKPSICNRLDRNTGGLLLFGKSLYGTTTLNNIIKNRSISKYYKTIVFGIFKEEIHLKGYLSKNEKTNKVTISNTCIDGAEPIETKFTPLRFGNKNQMTELEVELITGKAHQIRAHLSSIGFPIIGDYKYGNRKLNDDLNKVYNLKNQFLYAYKIVFPHIEDYPDVSNKTFSLSLDKLIDPFFEE